MATATGTLSKRVLSVASPRQAICFRGFRQLLSHQSLPTSLRSRRTRFNASCLSRRTVAPHLRHFASQTDGLGRTETFKEYRLREQIEVRRRAIRDLQNEALKSHSELSNIELEMNLQELDHFRLQHPSKSDNFSSSSLESSTPTTTILKSLTPHEYIYNIPNLLTFSRLLAAPAVGYAILTSQPTLALGLFFYAGVTDAVDGYLARRFHQTTVVGTVIDPMADKLLMTIAVVSLAVQEQIPLWLAVVIIGRDVALAISAIYFRWISLPPPKTMARYWDFSLPSAEVHPTEISKVNTFLQLMLIGSAMTLPVLRENMPAMVDAWNLGGMVEGWNYLVGATTVWSGLSYIGNKDAVKILSQDDGGEKRVVKEEGPLYGRK